MCSPFIPDAGTQEQAEHGLAEQCQLESANAELDTIIRNILRGVRNMEGMSNRDFVTLCMCCGIDHLTL